MSKKQTAKDSKDSLNHFGLVFHHSGLIVCNPDSALQFFKEINYRIGPIICDPHQNVNIIMCEHDEYPWIEIIYPASGGGPLADLIARPLNEVLHYDCYFANDLEQSLRLLKEAQFSPSCVSPLKPAALFNGDTVCFYSLAGMRLIEIVVSQYAGIQ
jgi:hypothetical protein